MVGLGHVSVELDQQAAQETDDDRKTGLRHIMEVDELNNVATNNCEDEEDDHKRPAHTLTQGHMNQRCRHIYVCSVCSKQGHSGRRQKLTCTGHGHG